MKKTEERVLEFLRPYPFREQSINQIAHALKTAYPNVYNTVRALEKSGLLKVRAQPPASMCRLNLQSEQAILFLSYLEVRHKDRTGISAKPLPQVDCCLVANKTIIGIQKRIVSTDAALPLQGLIPGMKATIYDSAGFSALARTTDIATRTVLWGFEEFYRILGRRE